MDDIDTSLEVKILEAKPRDIGKKRIRIDNKIMKSLKIKPGDVIQILGKKISCAVAWPADEDDVLKNSIRIDGQTRKNISQSLDDHIKIKKQIPNLAKNVILIPLYENVNTDREYTNFIKNRIKNTSIVKDDEISVTILGNSIEFRVEKTEPNGIVMINDDTILKISQNTIQDTKTQIMYDEIGGLESQVSLLRDAVELPLKHPEFFIKLGIELHAGVLLYGPPGCGKTLIAKILASESYAKMFIINGPEILNKYYGETEAKLRDIFKEAKENAPSIIFIDEIDAIAPHRENVQGEVEKRIVGQLLALMDGITDRGNVIVLGATNRPDSIDPALRRPGRFDREIEIPVPNIQSRISILQIYTRGMPLKKDVKLKLLATDIKGYTGADIKLLCKEAAVRAIKRHLPEKIRISDKIPYSILQSMEIKRSDFYKAMQKIVPTALREFYIEQPKIYWKDIIGLDDVKEKLKDNLILAMNEPQKFDEIGIKPPHGVLLYGPSGCGKSLLAQALATQSNANVIYVHSADILSKWIGESEKAIKKIFLKAKSSAPCVIILDEIDMIAKKNNENIINQIITEMQNSLPQVCVAGITNRPDLLDTALLAAHKLDILLYVPPPSQEERFKILKSLVKNFHLDKDVDLQEIAKLTYGYTGGDLSIICRGAAIQTIRRKNQFTINDDFKISLSNTRPSINKELIKNYENVEQVLSSVNIDKDGGLYS